MIEVLLAIDWIQHEDFADDKSLLSIQRSVCFSVSLAGGH